MSGPTRILIVDDHVAVRLALSARLAIVPGFDVVGDTGDFETALWLLISQRADVVLVDPRRADGRGLELVTRLVEAGRGVRVVALSSFATDLDRWTTRQAGASDYLLKEIDTAAMARRIQTALVSVCGA